MVATVPIKIWYQSFVDSTDQAPYFRALGKALEDASDPGVTFDLKGMVPPDRELNRLTELRCSAQVVRNAIAAQREGYDAFAIGHFQDGGLYEARAAVDIPVLALGETSMLHACTLGHAIGIITIHPVFIPILEELVTRYGLRERVVAVKAITSSPADLVSANEDSKAFDHFLHMFRTEVKPLVERGVEVIIPGGGLPAALLARAKDFTVGSGVIILDPLAVLAKTTELAVKLRRLNGTGVSRAGRFVKASEEAIREFLENR